MASVYCRNCGQQIEITSSFCTFCGAAQAASPPPVEPVPPPPPPAMPIQASPPLRQRDQFGLPVNEGPGAESQQADMGRALFPRPPSLHWALVFLFTLLTFGIFGWVWYFVQSSWVKKIDKRSNATVYFICALVSWLLLVPVVVFSTLANNGQESLGMSVAVLLLEVAAAVFMYCGFFSMAGSLRDEMPKRGVRMSIGGITLFFFTVLYTQGQLSWLAHWKDTGQKEPPPPKGIFWGLFVAFLGLVLAGVIVLVALVGITLPGFNRSENDARTATVAEPVTIPQDVAPVPTRAQPLEQPAADAGNADSMPASPADAAILAADTASVASDSTTDQVSAYDLDELKRQRAQAEVELERETLLQERKRMAEQQRRMDEQQRGRAYEDGSRQNASVEQQPNADELYEGRRGECPSGFLGSDCRKRIRVEVCEGHWSSNPPLGYQACRL
jgi:hypothetical protein